MYKFYKKGIYNATYKIIAIGDLHGDFRATITSLVKGNIIDNNGNWNAGKTHVVQMGDILDRKPRSITKSDEDSEFKILQLFLKLQKQAYKAGGAFHCLLGNHELLNVLGQFTYVSQKGLNHFKTNSIIKRKNYFKPGGLIAKLFASSFNVVIKIGKFIFVHGGISLDISKKYNINQINNLMKNYLMGNTRLFYTREFKELFLNNHSLLWNRQYSRDVNRKKCNELKRIVKNQGGSYMVIGHTPQEEGINSKCNIIWRIDTGMSEAFGSFNLKRIQILKIINNGKKIEVIK